tara:strand:- start:354 stop:944 length:591 start_codon:yes stop_codon:yes gene_type:complete
MTSSLQVETIQNPAGVAIFDTFTEIDCWRLVSDFTGTADVITDWERANSETGGASVSNMPVGIGLNENNGTWSFPRTGLYKIDVMANLLTTVDDAGYSVGFYFSVDDGLTYDELGRITHAGNQSDTLQTSTVGTFFLNAKAINGPTAVKFQLKTIGMLSGGSIQGVTADENNTGNADGKTNQTCVLCTKLAPAVIS